jgi:hypothetical protein
VVAARRAAVVLAAALTVAACAGSRIEGNVFRGESGYRVTLPASPWQVVQASEAGLELRHAVAPAGMLVSATCAPAAVRRPPELLVRHLLVGVRDREILEAGEMPVNGRVATHTLLEGRWREGEDRVRIEAYVLKGTECVYDLLYVAAPGVFAEGRDEFRRFVESFETE